MEKIQLVHPLNKKAISMNSIKYAVLRNSLLACLKIRKQGPFDILLADVEKDLPKRSIQDEGQLG